MSVVKSVYVCVSYLEELSRRYKRQMEEMYSSLNRTISKLSNTAKIAAEQVIVLCHRVESVDDGIDV